ncbi:hypothetical protein EV183_005175 [Coemansia sp. RSA 2336]|nr:hypothetical protein EV183_005175 [Coemansia sp. RSA 2336]
MVSDSSQTLVLKPQVHARLFNAHVLKAVQYESSTAASARSVVTFAKPGNARSLVFSRVRISGTVVQQTSAVVAGSERTFIYIDDGTGVVPFALRTHCKSETERLAADEMERRLSVVSEANRVVCGLTVEVLGTLHYRQAAGSMAAADASLPYVWVECSHLTFKHDAMAEVSAALDILSTYTVYFPDTFHKASM